MFELLVITEKDIAPPFLSDVLRNKQVLLYFWTGLLGVWGKDKCAVYRQVVPESALKRTWSKQRREVFPCGTAVKSVVAMGSTGCLEALMYVWNVFISQTY